MTSSHPFYFLCAKLGDGFFLCNALVITHGSRDNEQNQSKVTASLVLYFVTDLVYVKNINQPCRPILLF